MENNKLNFIEPGDFLINEQITYFRRLSSIMNSLNIDCESFKDERGKPMHLVLTVSRYCSFTKVYALVFFLKDYGLEYIYLFNPVDERVRPSKKYKNKMYPSIPKSPIFILGDYYADIDPHFPFGSEPLHISEFLTYCPNTLMDKFVKAEFPGQYESSLDRESREESERIENSLREDYNYTVNNAVDFAFDGDPSNYWNID